MAHDKEAELLRRLQIAEAKTAVKKAEWEAAKLAEDHAYKRLKEVQS